MAKYNNRFKNAYNWKNFGKSCHLLKNNLKKFHLGKAGYRVYQIKICSQLKNAEKGCQLFINFN